MTLIFNISIESGFSFSSTYCQSKPPYKRTKDAVAKEAGGVCLFDSKGHVEQTSVSLIFVAKFLKLMKYYLQITAPHLK